MYVVPSECTLHPYQPSNVKYLIQYIKNHRRKTIEIEKYQKQKNNQKLPMQNFHTFEWLLDQRWCVHIRYLPRHTQSTMKHHHIILLLFFSILFLNGELVTNEFRNAFWSMYKCTFLKHVFFISPVFAYLCFIFIFISFGFVLLACTLSALYLCVALFSIFIFWFLVFLVSVVFERRARPLMCVYMSEFSSALFVLFYLKYFCEQFGSSRKKLGSIFYPHTEFYVFALHVHSVHLFGTRAQCIWYEINCKVYGIIKR